MYSFAKQCAAVVLCVAAAYAQKQYKDGEFDAYNAVVKDLGANNATQAIAHLQAWETKFPQSDYAPERQALFIRAFTSAKQWPAVLDRAAGLLDQGLDRLSDPREKLQALYSAALALPQTADPTGRQMEAGVRAARALLAFDTRWPGVSDADWTKLKADLQGPAKTALLYAAMLPGNRALTKQPRDCAAAEAAYRKALEEFPESAAVSFNLANALYCGKKPAEAVYQWQRAVGIDPTIGGSRDAAQTRSMADSAYAKLHGSEEGLAELKEVAKRSPLPAAGFAIKTAAEIEADKEAALEAQNPQLALWLKIRAALTASNGAEYFESQLKHAAVPQLRGALVEARPACRPKELLVAAGGPGSAGEILLRLDAPLARKPQSGSEFRWEGVPSAFTSSPFLLTMDTEAKAVQGLTLAACGAAPRKK